jgi:hypothetical protein
MTIAPRRREPAINRAMRALGLPPLLTGDYEDEPAMSRDTAWAIVAAYTALYTPLLGVLVFAALRYHHSFPH